MPEGERTRVFESWIDAHKAILFKVARVYGATHSHREDLFQEIALQVWHSVEAYRGDCAHGGCFLGLQFRRTPCTMGTTGTSGTIIGNYHRH